jgi:hypothetical protein
LIIYHIFLEPFDTERPIFASSTVSICEPRLSGFTRATADQTDFRLPKRCAAKAIDSSVTRRGNLKKRLRSADNLFYQELPRSLFWGAGQREHGACRARQNVDGASGGTVLF